MPDQPILPTLRNAIITTTPDGPVEIAIDNIGFLIWAQKGEQQALWPDGRSMLRAMLRERARHGDGTSISASVVEA